MILLDMRSFGKGFVVFYKKMFRINIMLVFVICIYVGIFVIYDFYVDCFLDENYIIIICILNCMYEYYMW